MKKDIVGERKQEFIANHIRNKIKIMDKEKLQQKRAELRKYLGASNGSKLILKHLGNTAYNNNICQCGWQETDTSWDF